MASTVNKQSKVPENHPSILQEAHALIYGDREEAYGDPSKNTRNIAAFWSVYLGAKHGVQVTLDSEDVCQMMILLKTARLANNPQHRDSLVDQAGYAALHDRVTNR